MNLPQRVNATLASSAVLALVVGLAQTRKPDQQFEAPTLLFAIFFVFFRLKCFLDDHRYFGAPERRWQFNTGFLLANVAWIFWVLAAHSIAALPEALLMLVIAILISTSWIVVEMLGRVHYDILHAYWLVTNLLYIGGLLTVKLEPEIGSAILVPLCFILLIDFALSESLDALHIE